MLTHISSITKKSNGSKKKIWWNGNGKLENNVSAS